MKYPRTREPSEIYFVQFIEVTSPTDGVDSTMECAFLLWLMGQEAEYTIGREFSDKGGHRRTRNTIIGDERK